MFQSVVLKCASPAMNHFGDGGDGRRDQLDVHEGRECIALEIVILRGQRNCTLFRGLAVRYVALEPFVKRRVAPERVAAF